MANQPPWSNIEAAILLEAVLNVENGMEKRKEAIIRVSHVLRELAKAQGVIFDDRYRNINGITFQFQSMEYSALKRVSPTHKTGSKVFDEVVRIKNQSPEEYYSLLNQAKTLLEASDKYHQNKVNEMSFRDIFKKWLLGTGSDEKTAQHIVKEFETISKYVKDRKVVAIEMWEISNAQLYSEYMRAVRDNKLFRVLQKDKYKFFQNNSKLYMSFLRSRATQCVEVPSNKVISESDFLVTDIDRELYTNYPDEFRSVFRVLKEDTKHAYLSLKQIIDLVRCKEDIVSCILEEASWAEKLGDGYVLGCNERNRKKKTIAFSIDHAYREDTRVDIILKEYFKRGFRPQSIMDRKRLINLYEEQFGDELSEDEAINYIASVSFLFDERMFLPKAVIDKDTAEKICAYVEHYFEEKEILFNDVLFCEFKGQFDSLIYSPAMLAAYVEKTLAGTALFFSEKYFSYNQSAKPDVSSEVIDYLIGLDRPGSYEEIYSAMPHLKKEDIYHVLHYNNPEILGNSKTEYFHVESAHVSERERTAIEAYCHLLLKNSKYVTCNEIIDRLPQIDAALAERCADKFSILGLRRILTYYLRAQFDVMTGVITRKGQQMTPKDVFADFAKTHQKFTVNDIQELSVYTGTTPYWETIHSYAVRINSTEFVSDDLIEFDSDAIDAAIAYYCDDYIPIARITDFMRFASCGYSWNPYLLQSYVYRFSSVFRLLHLGFAKSDVSGVIVKKQLLYLDFEAVIVDALSKTDILTEREALDYLCDCGYIVDRRYKKVGELLKKAVVLRKK